MSIKFNSKGGLVLLFGVVVWLGYSGSMPFSMLVWGFLTGGVVLLAAARLWGRGTVPSFIFALLWTGYWGFVSYQGFIVWGFFAVAGSGWLVFWSSLFVGLLFGLLAIVNLFALFLIPKPEQKS